MSEAHISNNYWYIRLRLEAEVARLCAESLIDLSEDQSCFYDKVRALTDQMTAANSMVRTCAQRIAGKQKAKAAEAK